MYHYTGWYDIVYTSRMRTYFVIFSLLLMLLLVLASTYFIYEERTFIFQSRANVQLVDSENSLAVATPSCVPADSTSISRLQVYCLNSRGLGEPGMIVSVKPSNSVQDLEITAIQGSTDQYGKAIFDLKSGTEGIFELTIMCGDVVVKSNHRACFTNG
jgi:hypothetical protein